MSRFGFSQWQSIIALCAVFNVCSADVARDFSRAPAFAYPALAPDGQHLSYVEQVDAQQVVFVRPTERSDPARPTLKVTLPNERVRWCGWSDIKYLLCGTTITRRKQHAIQEATRLYAIDAATQAVRELAAQADGHRDQVIDLMPHRPKRVLLQRDQIGRGYPDVVDLDVASGEWSVVVRAQPPIRTWLSDGRGHVRLGLGYDNGRARAYVPEEKGDGWRLIIDQRLSDPEALGPIAVGASASELFALKHHHGRAAVFRLDPSHPTESSLVLSDPLYDVSGPLEFDPLSRELLAIRYPKESPTTRCIAERECERRAWLDVLLPELVSTVLDRSLDGSKALVLASSDTDSPSLHLANFQTRSLSLVGHQYPQLEPRSLAPMRSLLYRARDGQRIPAYLSTPQSGDGPWPAIVLPHGGPETRDVRQFDPLVQFLVAKGFAVLQMNFRGSLGYGAGFASAGAQQWGGVIHNDITDGAQWLIEQKIADPQRLCILGSSFGGYAALLGAAKESQWYACAMSYAGASDLMAWSQTAERLPDADMWRQRLGADSRVLWQTSPLAMVRQIETPILLVHGPRDAVVPVSQSRRLARALSNSNKSHTFIERPDCDHAMTANACRYAVFSAIDQFLNNTIGRIEVTDSPVMKVQ